MERRWTNLEYHFLRHAQCGGRILKRKSSLNPSYQGFTVIELLVSIAIVGLMMAITIPAVQSSRENARATDCRNRLKQVGIAMHSHQESHGGFPTESWSSQLAPFFETVNNKSSNQLTCPSDSHEKVEPNYVINEGTVFRFTPRNGFSMLALRSEMTQPRDITDGLSHTAAFSERLRSWGAATYTESQLRSDPLRYPWYISENLASPGNESNMAIACQTPVTPYPYAFSPDSFSGCGYDHRLPPNTRTCVTGPPPTTQGAFLYLGSFITATSLHRSSVHVLFSDGSVRPISNSVDLGAWMAIGTRNGNETVGVDL